MDKVRPLKVERIASGGSQDNEYPHELNPNEDGLMSRGALLQNDSSDDDTVVVSRDASDNMTFKDGVVSGTKTLSELLEGEDAFDEDDILTSKDGHVLVNADGNVLITG